MSGVLSISLAKSLQEQGIGETVRSNHQENLINWYYGRRKNLSYGLNYTVEEFKQLEPEVASELINWLEGRPYFYSFTNNGQLYTCVHAYYESGISQYHPGGKAALAIYGPRENEQRVAWWEDPSYYHDDKIILFGHYHLTGCFPSKENPKAIAIDGGCGNTGGELYYYVPHLNLLSN
jgi:hypothetical protein